MSKRIEVDEDEWLRHQQLSNTISQVMADPKARLLAEKAIKTKFPDAKTPLLDEETSKQELTSSLEKKMDDFLKAQAEEKAKHEHDAKLAQINANVEAEMTKLRQAGWREPGLKALREMMETKGILSPLDAAAIYERDHPPETPMNPGTGGAMWNLSELPADDGDADYVKKLLDTKGSNDMVTEARAKLALQEFRGQLSR